MTLSVRPSSRLSGRWHWHLRQTLPQGIVLGGHTSPANPAYSKKEALLLSLLRFGENVACGDAGNCSKIACPPPS